MFDNDGGKTPNYFIWRSTFQDLSAEMAFVSDDYAECAWRTCNRFTRKFIGSYKFLAMCTVRIVV